MAIVESTGEKRSGWRRGLQDLDSILRGDLTRLSSLREGR